MVSVCRVKTSTIGNAAKMTRRAPTQLAFTNYLRQLTNCRRRPADHRSARYERIAGMVAANRSIEFES